jgi:hypothetical protein
MDRELTAEEKLISLLAQWLAERCESCPSFADFLVDQWEVAA